MRRHAHARIGLDMPARTPPRLLTPPCLHAALYALYAPHGTLVPWE